MSKIFLVPGGALVAVTVVLGMSACGSGDPESTGPLALKEGGWNSDDALLTGVLVREGNCLYVDYEGPYSSFRTLLALSVKGTSWDEEEQAVRIRGATLRVGEEVAFGGGENNDVERYKWAVPPDPSCDTTLIWNAGLPN